MDTKKEELGAVRSLSACQKAAGAVKNAFWACGECCGEHGPKIAQNAAQGITGRVTDGAETGPCVLLMAKLPCGCPAEPGVAP